MDEDNAPSYATLDQSIQQTVNEMTRVYMQELARLAEEVAEADEDDEGAPTTADLPNLTEDKLRDWLVRVCAPPQFVASSLHQYVASVVAAKMVSLRSITFALDATVEEFLSGVEHTLLRDDLIVNEPLAMGYVEKFGLPAGRVMLIPVPDLREPDPPYDEDGDETAGIAFTDGLIAVVPWEGAYLCRTALLDLSDVEQKLGAVLAEHPILPKPNTHYRQGKPH